MNAAAPHQPIPPTHQHDFHHSKCNIYNFKKSHHCEFFKAPDWAKCLLSIRFDSLLGYVALFKHLINKWFLSRLGGSYYRIPGYMDFGEFFFSFRLHNFYGIQFNESNIKTHQLSRTQKSRFNAKTYAKKRLMFCRCSGCSRKTFPNRKVNCDMVTTLAYVNQNNTDLI